MLQMFFIMFHHIRKMIFFAFSSHFFVIFATKFVHLIKI